MKWIKVVRGATKLCIPSRSWNVWTRFVFCRLLVCRTATIFQDILFSLSPQNTTKIGNALDVVRHQHQQTLSSSIIIRLRLDKINCASSAWTPKMWKHGTLKLSFALYETIGHTNLLHLPWYCCSFTYVCGGLCMCACWLGPQCPIVGVHWNKIHRFFGTCVCDWFADADGALCVRLRVCLCVHVLYLCVCLRASGFSGTTCNMYQLPRMKAFWRHFLYASKLASLNQMTERRIWPICGNEISLNCIIMRWRWLIRRILRSFEFGLTTLNAYSQYGDDLRRARVAIRSSFHIRSSPLSTGFCMHRLNVTRNYAGGHNIVCIRVCVCCLLLAVCVCMWKVQMP